MKRNWKKKACSNQSWHDKLVIKKIKKKQEEQIW
jgi:hypothetical protein